VRRAAFAFVAVLAAILLQLTVLDNLPFPGGSAPNLVLVLVVTLALASGPRDGMLVGFGAGLVLDAAPPAGHLLGLSALVFCLVGYGCGLMRGPLERSSWLPLGGVAVGVTAGESLYALTGLIFGDPDITWQSIRQVLPASVVYDLLLSPFVLYAVVRLGSYGGWATAGARESDLVAGLDLPGAGLSATGAAVRDTRSGREPRLRAAAGRQADGWIGGRQHGPGQPAGAWVQRRRPLHLRIRGGVAGSATGGGVSQGRLPDLTRPVHLRLGAPRRRDGVVGGSLRGLVGGLGGLGGAPGRSAAMRGAAFRGSGRRSASLAGEGLAAGLLRPVSPARLRKRTFRGGPSALADAGRGRLGRAPRLRLGGGRRRDGVVGGGVLGSGRSGGGGAGGGMGGSSRGMPGGAFGSRAPGAPGPLRPGRSQGAVPRFRGAGRGLFGGWRGDPLGGRRGGLGGARGGLGDRRSSFGSRRRRFGARLLRRSGPRGRSALRRMGSKRTGGLP
jgi:rod shape-determining protein MreD